MTLDLVEIFLDITCAAVKVIDVALFVLDVGILGICLRKKSGVVIEVFDC